MAEEVHFSEVDIPTSEIERREAVTGALAESVRDLVDATIRSTVDDAEIAAVRAEVEALTARLRVAQLPGPAGVRYNKEGRSWGWGNAVIGQRNAVAPPLVIVHADDEERSHAEVTLGAAYEGPPGMVHGGVSALLMDQVMGETASQFRRLTMTGTLTLRYLRPLPLGPVRIDCWIASEVGRKVTVEATIGNPDGTAVEAHGLFIIPSWAVMDEETGETEGWRRSAEG